MLLDAKLNFGIPDITNSTAAVAGTNVYDAGAARILFTADYSLKIIFKTVLTADASPTIKLDFVGSGESDLDADWSEADNVLLGSSGIIRVTADGTAIATGETVEGYFMVQDQRVAKRYYGLIVTLGGTNPDTVAATSFAHGVLQTQTNMRGAQAAIPAT